MTTRPDGGYRLVAAVKTDAEVHSDAEIERSFAPSVRVPWAIVGVLITAAASVTGTYLATRNAAPPSDTHSELNALDKHVTELSTAVNNLAATVARNADQAHNDTANVATELHAYINSHAR